MPKQHYLFSFLAGAVLTLAFAPFEYRIIALISPAIFFHLLYSANSLKQHMGISYLFGVGLFATGASWIFYSMYFFSQAHIVLAIGLTSLFVLLMALFFLPLALLAYYLRQSHRLLTLVLIFPAVWVLAEWLRGWLFTGFPWLYLAHTHIDDFLINVAPIGGGLLVSWLSATLSGLLIAFLLGDKRERVITASATGVLLISVYATQFIQWTSPLDQAFKVTLLQGNIPQQEKWLPENLHPTIERYQEMTNQHLDSDIIIWPETALPSYFHLHLENLIEPLNKLSTDTNTDIILGGFFHNSEGKAGAENSILAISGNSREIYSKQHLVPFSEYIPFLEHLRWLEKWIKLPYDSVKRGQGSTLLTVAGYRAQMSVCYEDAYGNEIIEGLPEAHFLINVSNDGWFTGSIEPFQHMEIARLRAVETGRYLLRSTNIGVSGIVDHKGRIVASAPAYTTTSITGLAQAREGSTFYVRFGNYLAITLIILTLLMTMACSKKPLTSRISK
ncbi:MAG: Apolipoprotein N-acyltransferase (EC / Copper homeostasis protein CutE [uncultured Thiotrichaceae bacterium]|uniref:Apolipoprotein N-acyltransferase n=1 Tax=uncultured Thiotrichaceae bacterium TaxID=298394 RepID=A0A6S6SPB3_9GAMM|nr:MAG: Apolipoprotein N-acyltransferase (EC / Copper homeostasis protein CutE [uncultured Thiotrichaceae bacterium]